MEASAWSYSTINIGSFMFALQADHTKRVTQELADSWQARFKHLFWQALTLALLSLCLYSGSSSLQKSTAFSQARLDATLENRHEQLEQLQQLQQHSTVVQETLGICWEVWGANMKLKVRGFKSSQEKLRQTKGNVEQATALAAAATKRRLRWADWPSC